MTTTPKVQAMECAICGRAFGYSELPDAIYGQFEHYCPECYKAEVRA